MEKLRCISCLLAFALSERAKVTKSVLYLSKIGPSATLGNSKAQKQGLKSPQSSGELLQWTTDHQLHVCISNSIRTPAITGLLKSQNSPSRAVHFAQERNPWTWANQAPFHSEIPYKTLAWGAQLDSVPAWWLFFLEGLLIKLLEDTKYLWRFGFLAGA